MNETEFNRNKNDDRILQERTWEKKSFSMNLYWEVQLISVPPYAIVMISLVEKL